MEKSRTEVIRSRDLLAGYANDLDALFTETNASVIARWDLIDIWLRYQTDVEPLAVLIWREEKLVAAAVLAVWAKPFHFRIKKIGDSSDPCLLAACDEASALALAAGLSAVLKSLPKPWSLYLSNLPPDNLAVAALKSQLPVCEVAEGGGSPQLRFAQGADLKKYLSRNTRSAVAKAVNRIAKDGLSFEMQWTSTPTEAERILPEVLRVLRHRIHQRWGSPLQNPAADRIFFDIVMAQARNGGLRLLTVRVSGALAAFAVCFPDRGLLWVYANLVSPEWLSYSAGTIANAEIVRAAHADPSITGVNWGPGLMRYKMSGEVVLSHDLNLLAWRSSLDRFCFRAVKALRSGLEAKWLARASPASPHVDVGLGQEHATP